MRILHANAENFASYKELAFDFTAQGLTLVAGPTGSGKSTLCDLVPWVLFGVTAKDGAVDEVRSWSGGVTVGTVVVEIDGKFVQVERIRGSAKDNDLCIGIDDRIVRGKDLNDTQKRINEILGLEANTFLAGAYFHEFSQVAGFFTANAKIRRQITEQLVDLEMPKKLGLTLTSYKKDLKTDIELHRNDLIALRTKLKGLESQTTDEIERADSFDQDIRTRVKLLESQSKAFGVNQSLSISKLEMTYGARILSIEADIKDLELELVDDTVYTAQLSILEGQIATLSEVHCAECGAKKDVNKQMALVKRQQIVQRDREENQRKNVQIAQLTAQIKSEESRKDAAILAEQTRANTYQEQIEALKHLDNRHLKTLEKLMLDTETTETNLKKTEGLYQAVQVELADTELLQEFTDILRATMVKNTVVQLETMTNKMLTDYFDAEIQVSFDISEGDKLEVVITKDGNEASYTQLSKGQRQLLKLCFGVAVMKAVQQYHSVSLNTLFFDEVFSALDNRLKLQGYRLLESLALDYETVIVIDHSEELKTMFPNRFDVELVSGSSQLEKV